MDLDTLAKANTVRLRLEKLHEQIEAVKSHALMLIVPLSEGKQLELVMSPQFKADVQVQVLKNLEAQAELLAQSLTSMGVQL